MSKGQKQNQTQQTGSVVPAPMSEMELVRNTANLLMRSKFAALLGQSFGGARDLYTTLGYNKLLQFQDFWNMFKRGRLGKRVISAPVEATWRGGIDLAESDETEDTQFEKDWKALDKQFRIVPKLSRFDKMVGLGEFAVLLLGFDDGAALDQPLVSGGATGKRKLIYIQPYHQGNVQIAEWEDSVTNPRYGLPRFYNIGINRVGLYSVATANEMVRVHHSRIIHVAEGLLDNEVLGTPRLESVFNGLADLEKIAGGNAEMYWQGALGGKAFSAKEGATFDTGARDAVQKEIDDYVNGMRRYLRLQNMDVQDLAPGIVDPKAAIDTQLDLIAGDTGIPKRILIGSERGELASTQDESNWLVKIKDRREQFAEPFIVRALVDRLIEVGAMSEPTSGEYQVVWADLWSPSDKEKADVAAQQSLALKNYLSAPGADTIVPPEIFFEKILGWDAEFIERVQKLLGQSDFKDALEEEAQAAFERQQEAAAAQTQRPAQGGQQTTGKKPQGAVRNSNPCHDENGRFCSTGGSGGGSGVLPSSRTEVDVIGHETPTVILTNPTHSELEGMLNNSLRENPRPEDEPVLRYIKDEHSNTFYADAFKVDHETMVDMLITDVKGTDQWDVSELGFVYRGGRIERVEYEAINPRQGL